MGNHNRQKNNKKPIDYDRSPRPQKKLIGDLQAITVFTTTAAGMFFALRSVGVEQKGALLTSTSLLFLICLNCI